MSHYDQTSPTLNSPREDSAALVARFHREREERRLKAEAAEKSITQEVGQAPWEKATAMMHPPKVGDTVPPLLYIGDVPPATPDPGFASTGTTSPLLKLAPKEKSKSTMDVWMIWVRNDSVDIPATYWLKGAWDDDSVGESRDEWEKTVHDAYAEHGGANVRVSKTNVNFDRVVESFEPAEV